jgi:hypothetical protein
MMAQSIPAFGLRARRAVALVAAFSSVLIGIVLVVAPPAAAAVPTGDYNVNINNREDVRQFFNLVHEAPVPADGWTGNIATCTPGTVSQAYLDATLTRINYFRTMSGEPDVTFSAANNAEAQASALIQSANGSLNHHPPSTGTGSTCWTQLGSDGAGASNLSLGTEGPTAIDSLMYDGTALGHRRNMLNPSITTMGSGSIPSNNGFHSSESQLVLTTPLATRPAVRSGFVAWPPAGFTPYQVVFPRWSFSLPGGDFSAATVTMQHNGSALPVQIRCTDPNVANDPNCGQYSEPAISWTPSVIADGADWPKPVADDPYTVTVSNVVVNGVTQAPFTYTVTIIDPSVSDAAHTASVAPSGPANPPVSQNSSYTVPAVPDASGYQWRTTASTPGDFVDGAENGLGNFTANISPDYTAISTAEHATGASSFHLRGFGGAAAPTQQTLTVNESVLANANSSLGFDSLYWNILNETASVDVSLDSGATWQSVFSESPPSSEQDAAFGHKTVSLSQFAGHQIQLRFALTFTGGNWAICCGEPNGWYFDNVSLSNVLAAATPTLSAVGANPSFTLNTAQQGALSIDVRPQFSNTTFGSSFGTWSPALPVTVVGSTGFTTLTSSANPSAAGQQVTFTATVAPTDGGGTVSFTDNGTAIGPCQALPLTNGQATCAQTYSQNQPTSIVATYSGDGNFAGTSSAPLNQVINAQAFTGGTMSLSSSKVNTGRPVTATVTMTPTDGGGTVNFSENFTTAIPGCDAVPLNAAGVATCTWTPTQATAHTEIDSFYSGDPNFISTNSGSQTLQVVQATSTALTSTANPATAGVPVGFTATVSPATSQGTVQFTDNGATIPGCGLTPLNASGVATCGETFANDGSHQIQASYSGFAMAATFSPSTSPILNQAVGNLTGTTTTMTSSANPSLTNQQVTFTATVASGDGGGSVTFTDAGTPIGGCQSVPLTAGQATCVQTYTDTAPHSLAASYSGDATTAGSSSAAVNQVVNQSTAAAPPAVSVVNLGNAAAQVAFTAPTGGARASSTSSVTGFNVYQGTSAGHESSTPINPSRLLATAHGYTVTGLTAGTKYFFVVKALNPGGLSPASAEVSARAATVPSAPRTLTAQRGAESAALTWTAPSSTGGSPITGYNLFVGTAPGAESSKALNSTPLAATARAYTAPGLTDGTKYYFTVRAVNAVASSAASNEASTTPVAAPRPPVRVVAYPGTASVGITWTASELTGGSAITGFNVFKGTVKGGESGTPVNSSPLPATASNYRITGLTNGAKVFVTVKAINAVGSSAASSEVNTTPTTSAHPPIWPGSLVAKPAAASAKLTWTAPVSNGGSAITGYNVYKGTVATGESGTPVNSAPLAASATTYTVTGLKNEQGYYFTVKAINALGLGAPSNEASAVPQATAYVPGAPGSVKAVGGTAKVTVSWAAPSWNGGSAITGYNVYKGTTPGGESGTPVNATPLAATVKTFAVTGLTGGKVYYLTVRAINAVGTGPASEVSGRAS